MVTAAADTRCWCGTVVGEAVGAFYRRCPACGTAVRTPKPPPAHFDVADDERDFYGHAYWTSYARRRALPDIVARARADLGERCLFWLERVLEVTQPPGRFLEVGCGHGGFVALMRDVGWDAIGTELSPWVVEFARQAWGARVLRGRLESLPLEPGYRCIAAFDVVEHVDDPERALARFTELLAPDGVLVLQTPWYRGEGPEWPMFQEDEHVHLFTAEAMREWLARAGLGEVLIRPSLFPYDMLVVAGRQRFPLRAAVDADREPGWRMPAAIRGLLDAGRAVREDHDARTTLAAESAARLGQVEILQARLAESEADRAARLERMRDLEETRRRETDALAQQIHALAADSAARLRQVDELTRLLRESEEDRAARLDQIEKLDELLRVAEADRAARLEVIRALEARIEAIRGTLLWRVYERVQAARGRRAR